jgi:translation initiation factor IF-2
MSDEKKLTLGARPSLSIKTTVEAGKVRQSFSHGRSKQVVVEVKKRKLIGRPGEAEEVAPPPPPPPPPPVAAAPKPAQNAPRKAAADDDMSSGERNARQEALQAALKRAEEERRIAAEQARLRAEQEREAQMAAEREAREARRRSEDDAASQPAPEPAAQPEPEAKTAPAAPKPADAPRPAARPVADGDDDAPRGPRGPGAAAPGGIKRRPPEPPAKPARTKGDDRRQSGKLTVTRALEDEDQVRVRSLAALKRAREKANRHMRVSGPAAKQSREVVVPETITVQELANRMAERAADVVKALFKMGMMVTVNQSIDQDTAELIVTDFGHQVKRVADSDVEEGLIGADDDAGDLITRPPVVTIMGHVDHGKTSLLDALRNTNVVAGEAGGITQHIGAYQVQVKTGQKITFLDTPGHEAFTAMRARGANITDIVILVVAADDGLMPQTIEAINHTKAAGVPMIVAINKCDKPGAQPDKVREALLQHDVQVERFGGEVQDVEVSALKRTGLDELTEKIVLQAELMELTANPERAAEGTVVEAELDKGRGPVATVLVRRGTLRVGDIFVIGSEWGKVRALIDDKGQQVKEAGPSRPVEVLGLSGVPGAGDHFSVVENEARAREVAAYRQSVATKKRTTTAAPTSLESMFSALKANKAKELSVVVKADVQGSVEAIAQAVTKLSTDEIKARVIHAAVGAVTESDVALAKASGAPILAFNVRPNANARDAAEREGVGIKSYSIIYDLVDDVKAAMAGELGPEMVETVMGQAQVREVFQAGKAGKAAGCLVMSGVMRRNLKVRLLRDNVVVWTGSLSSLRRFKDDVNEVRAGLECGMALENYQDIKQGDVIESFEVESRERTL